MVARAFLVCGHLGGVRQACFLLMQVALGEEAPSRVGHALEVVES